MDGLQVQAAMTERGINMPVIFATGHGDVSVAVQAMKAGAIDFLEKPFEKRSEEHTSELQSLMRISYAVFCLKKTNKITHRNNEQNTKHNTPYKSYISNK